MSQTTPTPIPSPSHLQSQLQTHGYVVLPSYIPASQVQTLLGAARDLAALARADRWPHLRTLPKQFPPWERSAAHGIWGVQHLLHPDLPLPPAERAAFAEVYFGDAVLGVVEGILDVSQNGAASGGEEQHTNGQDTPANSEERGLVMELFNMLVTPERDFALRWHRDAVSFDLTREQEAAALGLRPSEPGVPAVKRRAWHAQYNIPLLPDCSLHVVPGSHVRPRTEREAALLAEDPYTDALPGWVEVKLQAGDVVFYDNDLIHRGVYRAGTERLTLHGSVGDVRAGKKRARNVLQHGWDWVPRCDFGGLKDERVRSRAEGMRARLVKLGRDSGDTGFAHDD